MIRKKTTPKQRALREMRRGEIVGAAREIVAGEGLEALTIAALEKRLGYSRGVISYHFRDKDEIVEAVLESALGEIDHATQAAVDKGETAIEKIEAVIRANVRGFLEHREAGLILLSFWGRLGSDPKARKANAQLYNVYRERTMSVLMSGSFEWLDPLNAAAVIVGLVIGIAAQVYFEPGSIDPEGAVNEGVRCVVARLSGALART